MHRCLQKPEGTECPGAVVAGMREPPAMCAEDGTAALSKSNSTLTAEPSLGLVLLGFRGWNSGHRVSTLRTFVH